MTEQLGDQPIQKEFEDMMNRIAFYLDCAFNSPEVVKDKTLRKTGFVLLLFPFNDDQGRCNYISNGANREDIIKLLEEQAKRFRILQEMKKNADAVRRDQSSEGDLDGPSRHPQGDPQPSS